MSWSLRSPEGVAFLSKPNFQERRFELLDTDLYPSISQKMEIENNKNKEVAEQNCPLNDQQVLKRLKPDCNSIKIDDSLFMLDDNDFMEAISVGSNEMFIKKNDTSILIESIEDSKIIDIKSEIIEKYCESYSK